MAIEVRIPTILRSYTGGAKVVEGSGDTLAELIDRPGRQHPGLRAGWSPTRARLHRFVNVYVNDEDVRFLGALDAKLSDGDSSPSCRPWPAARWTSAAARRPAG